MHNHQATAVIDMALDETMIFLCFQSRTVKWKLH